MRLPLLLAVSALELACGAPAATAPPRPAEVPVRQAKAPINEDPLAPRIHALPAMPPPRDLPEDPPPPRPPLDEPVRGSVQQPLVIATPAPPPPPWSDESVSTDAVPAEETPIATPDGRPDAQPARPGPNVPDPVGPERLLYCERRSGRCWACATLDLTVEQPCEKHVCNTGICVASAVTGKARCAPAESRCCDGTACERAPTRTACAPSCGDPSGDGVFDRCLLPDSCAEETLLRTDVIKSYQLARPPSWYRALCGPIPAAARAAVQERRPNGPVLQLAGAATAQVPSAAARCDGTPVLWTIPAEVMATGASDRGGPGICYGGGIDTATGRLHTCGHPHCDTLRYCDGRERATYCTVVSACVDGVRRATGFTW